MEMDRSWMYDIRRSSLEYREGVTAFINCNNEKMFENSLWVQSHMIRIRFMDDYRCWSKHDV
uniref:Uncharacterized protein n=1 Tax=Oryza sativa subsp. japonica TaxID=39947 RepID=Q6UU24_ORYSJ|nr:hypothetical protein OSJNBa0096K16.19 [Oryza sativa Japonica Group]